MKVEKIIQKIKRVEEIKMGDILKAVESLGGHFKQGQGSCLKVYIGETVTTLHCKDRILKYGVVRTLKNTLKEIGV